MGTDDSRRHLLQNDKSFLRGTIVLLGVVLVVNTAVFMHRESNLQPLLSGGEVHRQIQEARYNKSLAQLRQEFNKKQEDTLQVITNQQQQILETLQKKLKLEEAKNRVHTIVKEAPRPPKTAPPAKISATKKEASNERKSATIGTFVPKKLHVMSFADKKVSSICNLASTTYHYGYPLHVLAWDDSTRFFDGSNCGGECAKSRNYAHAKKRKMYWLKHFFNHYQDYGLDDDDIVVFTDAHDVFAQRPLDAIKPIFSRLLQNKRGVIFNGEAVCGASFNDGGEFGRQVRSRQYLTQIRPHASLANFNGGDMCNLLASKAALSWNQGPYWSLNSGAFVGDVKSLQSVMNKMVELAKDMTSRGDQIVFHRTYLRYPDLNIVVDTNAELFFCWSYMVKTADDIPHTDLGRKQCKDEYMKDDGVPSKHKLTQTRPFFMHFPGVHRPFYKSCVAKVVKFSKSTSTQYFVDVDRKQNVSVHSVCKEFS